MNRANFALAALVVCALLAAAVPAAAKGKKIDAKADQYLREMSDYLANVKAFSFQADLTFDEVQDNGQKIQLSNVRKVTVRRPNGLRVSTTGDTINREIYYDGKTITAYVKEKNVYTTLKTADTIHGMLDDMHEKTGRGEPLADLLFPNPYKVLTEHIQSGKYLGLHHVGKVKCHHLAFRQKTLDWHIWIQEGDKPLPRKMVITYKRDAGGPQFTARLSKWDTSPKVTSETFVFKPPEGSEKVTLENLMKGGPAKKEQDNE